MLHGFGVGGFRSFLSQQFFSPLVKVNVLVGTNNAGKSNVIRFVDRYLNSANGTYSDPGGLDIPLHQDVRTPFEIAIAVPLSVVEEIVVNKNTNVPVRNDLETFIESSVLHQTRDDLVWFHYEIDSSQGSPGLRLSQRYCVKVTRALTRQADLLTRLSAGLTSTSGGAEGENARRVLGWLDPWSTLKQVTVIDAFRQIEAQGQRNAASGLGLVNALAQLQNPSPLRRGERRRFDEINRFLQTVLDDPDVSLEVPYERDTLSVHQHGRVLPLDHYGTGVHQVVILAAAASVHTGQLLCIEEPEIHLHPLLQRKLIRFLHEYTDNQYLITTHSAHMLDYENAAVFHLRETASGTQVDPVVTPVAVAAACADLGYRPSDLIQANSVIWVEGPSDRIYLKHWLGKTAPDLVEGIHFSIMFYGGRLLAHLTVLDDATADDLICLRRLNRHSAVVMDSDKLSSRSRLNATKVRIRDEFVVEGPGFAWITDGHTIENYVPPELLKTVVNELYPAVILAWNGDKFINPLAVPRRGSGTKFALDKVKIARLVCNRWMHIASNPGLVSKIDGLVSFVQEAQQSPHSADG